MGNEIEAVPNRLKNAYNPNLSGWVILQKENKVNLWQNKQTGELLEQFCYTATDKAQLLKLRAHFEHRFNKPYIVASKFFRQKQTDELCSSFYETSMFIQFIGLRLSQFRDVTYPDSLHLYNACLHGFGELQARLGFFDVSDNLVGLNQLGQIKVWANADFSKERPRLTVTKDGQSQMLKEVIELVNSSIDTQTQPQSIKLYLNQNSKSFQQAVAALKEFAARYEIEIPTCMDTVNHLREKKVLDAGPFIHAEPKPDPPVVQSRPAPHVVPAQTLQVIQDSKLPISFLHAEAMKQFPLPIQKSPSAMINANPKITSVMYHPIDIGGNPIAPQHPRENIIVNTNNRKRSQQMSSIYMQNNYENKSQNIKQSQIISEMIPVIPSEQEVLLVNNHRPKNSQQRPIYLSTPAFVQRGEGVTTAGNIATLNQKYYNIAPPSQYYPGSQIPPLPPRDNYLSPPHMSQSISNLARNTQKRHPSIFTSLHGSSRRFNPKASEQQGQAEFFNNTIIYSIENEVRRDQMQANMILDAKRNKLRVCHPLELSIKDGEVINRIQAEILSQSNLKQSAIQVFSITINNTHNAYVQGQREGMRMLSEGERQMQNFGHQKIHRVYYNHEEQEPIRYTENQLYNQQFPVTNNSQALESPQKLYHNDQTSNQKYNYVPNYSFDKEYSHPVHIQQGNNFVERREVEIQKTTQESTSNQYSSSIPKQQIHYQSLLCHAETQAQPAEHPPISKNDIGSTSSLILKATIRNPHKVQSSLKAMAIPSGNEASNIISSIQEIRNSQKQLREQLKKFI